MTRFAECAWSELPFASLKQGPVDASVSSGCNCKRTSTQEPDDLGLELDAILEACGVDTGNEMDQP